MSIRSLICFALLTHVVIADPTVTEKKDSNPQVRWIEKPMVVDAHVRGGGPNIASVSGTFEISEEGKAENITVGDSPHEKLTLVSKRGIAQWQFNPGRSEGKPSRFLQKFVINYHYSGPLDKIAEFLVVDQEQAVKEESAPAKKEPREHFPHRTDLPTNGSFTQDPTHTLPSLIHRPPVKYPRNIAPGVHKLAVAFIIENDGRVEEAIILNSSGIVAIDDAHVAWVRQWKFKPASIKGEPIATVAMQPFAVESQ